MLSPDVLNDTLVEVLIEMKTNSRPSSTTSVRTCFRIRADVQYVATTYATPESASADR
ncbi:MAG: hypothetical protein J07HQW2_01680 [Haloquadratum walsbyi J07HQW2]|uniref:Uncharacterized protein n=1 Tax=Haloquadratum walsbyi J07HQW2 TaxID=1238425 RepID=U1PS82_9EURY|nr:MAG: hypothetical protein J07HQW2_01680 [Haloquadratum walsbyi J07HQW2]